MPPLKPERDKTFGGSLVFLFWTVMTSRENDLLASLLRWYRSDARHCEFKLSQAALL